MKTRLFTPGPVMVPEKAMLKMAEPIFHHRTPEYEALFEDVCAKLRKVFLTEGDVFTLASSGTGAMETAVVNAPREGRPRPYGPRRQIRRTLVRDLHRIWHRHGRARCGVGLFGVSRAAEKSARRQSRCEGRLHHPVGNIDRRDHRSQGNRRGHPFLRCRACHRCCVRSRRP